MKKEVNITITSTTLAQRLQDATAFIICAVSLLLHGTITMGLNATITANARTERQPPGQAQDDRKDSR